MHKEQEVHTYRGTESRLYIYLGTFLELFESFLTIVEPSLFLSTLLFLSYHTSVTKNVFYSDYHITRQHYHREGVTS